MVGVSAAFRVDVSMSSGGGIDAVRNRIARWQHTPTNIGCRSAGVQPVGQLTERVRGVMTVEDTTVVPEMLDRLLHRSVVLKLDGDSYRLLGPTLGRGRPWSPESVSVCSLLRCCRLRVTRCQRGVTLTTGCGWVVMRPSGSLSPVPEAWGQVRSQARGVTATVPAC